MKGQFCAIYLLVLFNEILYFQGGFPDSPICSDGIKSREGSSSDTEGESFPGNSAVKELDASIGNNVQNDRRSPSPSCIASTENGKVWQSAKSSNLETINTIIID